MRKSRLYVNHHYIYFINQLSDSDSNLIRQGGILIAWPLTKYLFSAFRILWEMKWPRVLLNDAFLCFIQRKIIYMEGENDFKDEYEGKEVDLREKK